MRLVTYSVGPAAPARAGVRVGHRVLDIESASRVKGEPLPSSVKALLAAGRGALARVQALAKAATTEARSFSQAMHEERAIRLLAPVPDPGRIECATGSADGASLAGHDAKVPHPGAPGRLSCEPALVFVVGRRASGLGDADAMDYVAGVTILMALAGVPGRAGEARLALTAGPEIVTLDELPDLHDVWMSCAVNGEVCGRTSANDPYLRLPDLLRRCSRDAPLEPGDLLCPGAPAGAGPSRRFLEPGDVVECAIEGIATLRATIAPPGAG